MTDREFKQLSRAQLIDIIYQLQLQNEKLTEQNQALKKIHPITLIKTYFVDL